MHESRQRRGIVCALALALAAVGVTERTMALTLVRDGVPTSAIVTNGRPSECHVEAARELQEHVRLMTGAELPIFKENELPSPAPEALILIGQGNLVAKHGINTKQMEPETFVVRTDGDALVLVGEDGGGRKNARTGTLWAVYDFLQDQLGCRWLWPGEIGRFVPRRATVEIGDLDIQETPLIRQRHLRASNQEKHKKMYEEAKLGRFFDLGETYDKLGEEERQWLRRMRMGKSIKIKGGHAFTDWWEKYKDESPDIFARQPDGRRRPRKMKRPDFVKMCVSNPKLWEKQLAPLREAARKGARGLTVNACENDGGGGFCTCARCRAWDADPNTGLGALPKVEDGSDVDGGPDQSDLPESLSDRYARWYNELARRVREFDPEAQVTAYAYSCYRSPPTNLQRIEPNVWIGYVGFNSYPRTPEYRKMSMDEWFGWSGKGATVFLRSNSLFYGGEGVPCVFSRQIAEDTRFQLANGLRATDYDCLQGLWATTGPSYYVLARLLWDTAADVEALLAEFYSAFGPMAGTVKEYFEYWEEFSAGLPEHPKIKDRNRTERLLAFPEVYTSDVLDRALEILNKGKPLLPEAPEDQRERFRNILLGLQHGRLLVEALKSGKINDDDTGRELLDFRRKYASRNVVNVYYTTYKENRYRVFE